MRAPLTLKVMRSSQARPPGPVTTPTMTRLPSAVIMPRKPQFAAPHELVVLGGDHLLLDGDEGAGRIEVELVVGGDAGNVERGQRNELLLRLEVVGVSLPRVVAENSTPLRR